MLLVKKLKNLLSPTNWLENTNNKRSVRTKGHGQNEVRTRAATEVSEGKGLRTSGGQVENGNNITQITWSQTMTVLTLSKIMFISDQILFSNV